MISISVSDDIIARLDDVLRPGETRESFLLLVLQTAIASRELEEWWDGDDRLTQEKNIGDP